MRILIALIKFKYCDLSRSCLSEEHARTSEVTNLKNMILLLFIQDGTHHHFVILNSPPSLREGERKLFLLVLSFIS
jgi:hypothetical protein